MQHGSPREYIIDRLEGAVRITTQAEVRRAINDALDAVEDLTVTNIDEPGVFGPDYALGVGVSGISESTVGRIEQ